MSKNILSIVLALALILILNSCGTVQIDEINNSELNNTAFKSSTYLLQMEDLKAINLAAKFLRGIGESVDFHETYIEYHEADIEAHLSLANGESIEYTGEYLEVRLYSSTDPVKNPCESCVVIYINGDGKVLGYNKISNVDTDMAATIAD